MKAATPAESTSSTSKSIARGAAAAVFAAAAPLDEEPRADRRGAMEGGSLAVPLSPPRERERERKKEETERKRGEREEESAPFFSLERGVEKDEVLVNGVEKFSSH